MSLIDWLFGWRQKPEITPKSKYDGWEIVHYPIVNRFKPRLNGRTYLISRHQGGFKLESDWIGETYSDYKLTRKDAMDLLDRYLETKGVKVNIEKL